MGPTEPQDAHLREVLALGPLVVTQTPKAPFCSKGENFGKFFADSHFQNHGSQFFTVRKC